MLFYKVNQPLYSDFVVFVLQVLIILVTIGILGAIHLLGSISSASVFNPPYWINWVHLSFGIFVFIVAFSHFTELQAGVILFAAIIGTTIGLLGLLLGLYAASHYNIPELADPSDHLAHLIVGIVALWAWRNRSRTKVSQNKELLK